LRSKHFIRSAQIVAKDSAATTIGALWRGGVARARVERLVVSVVMIQGIVRMTRARSRYKCIRNAVLRLQADHRCLRAKANLNEVRKAATRIQSWWRWNVATYRFAAAKFLVVQFQALWRGVVLRSRVRRLNFAAATIQGKYRIATDSRRLSASAIPIQACSWEHVSCQRRSCCEDASRTIQRWYLCAKVKQQLLLGNSIRTSLATHSAMSLDRQWNHAPNLADGRITTQWNQAMDDAKRCAAITLQTVVRSFLSGQVAKGADNDEDDARPRGYVRRCVAVRVLTHLSESSVDVELCPLLNRERHDAARKLQRFFTVCVRREAKASRQRVEAELVALRAERAAQRTAASALAQIAEFSDDPNLEGLGLCIPRLAMRARAARAYLLETTQSVSSRNDATQTSTSVQRANRRVITREEAWNY
jgi:hypothetical protein